jgi:predicted nucleic acid-binding protein
MTAVFLDTVGLLALWDVSDQWHSDAEVAFQRLTARRASVVTTAFVLLECGNAAARRPYRDEVDRLRQFLEQRHEVVTPTHDDWDTAWAAYARGEAGQAGIVDHVSFAVMRRLGIQEAFTNDQHFRAAGFQTSF